MMPFYIVKSAFNGKQPFIHEVDLIEATLTKTVEHIADGQFDCGQIAAVYFCDPDNGVMRDDTVSVGQAVLAYLRDNDMVPGWTVASFLDWAGVGPGNLIFAANDIDTPNRDTDDEHRLSAAQLGVRIAMGAR
jgi:hypothetical protein